MQSSAHTSLFKDGLLLWSVSCPYWYASWQQGEKGAKTKGTELHERIEKGRGAAEEL